MSGELDIAKIPKHAGRRAERAEGQPAVGRQ